jgi:hypothetical protein
MPDLLGLPLEEAQEILRGLGLCWELQQTAPPKGAPEGTLRVLRQTETERGVLLLVGSVPDGIS